MTGCVLPMRALPSTLEGAAGDSSTGSGRLVWDQALPQSAHYWCIYAHC